MSTGDCFGHSWEKKRRVLRSGGPRYRDVASRTRLQSASQNVLLVPCYKLSGLGRHEFRVAGPLVWNSITHCLRDPALERASFKRQLKTFLFAHY